MSFYQIYGIEVFIFNFDTFHSYKPIDLITF